MKMAIQKLLRKISFASKPGIEEMLANDDFTKYTQDDLDRFEEILIQNSEDRCKDMIRSYFKVLSSLAKRGRGDGFFGRVVSVFRKMLHSTPDTAEKHEQSTAAPSKKRRRRSSTGISKRIKREDPAACKAEVVGAAAVCVDGTSTCASHAIRERTASDVEPAHLEPAPSTRRQRRKMSYGYCPEDLVGKPISPDLFTRAINPEYNFLPGLPKLVLGDIPTDEEDEYFRKKEYMSSLSDEYDEKCNFNDGKPYNCRRCVEKEYVDKMEGLGLLGGDAGLLGVVTDRRYVHTDDRRRDDMHSLHEKRRKIEGKYYVDWVIKTDTPCAEHALRRDSSLEAHGAYSNRENAADGGAERAGAAVAERSSAGEAEAADRADGDNTDAAAESGMGKANAAAAESPFAGHFSDRKEGDDKGTAPAESIQPSSKNTEERKNACVFGSSEGSAFQPAKLVLANGGDCKRHELNASFVAQTLHAPQTNTFTEATLETELPRRQIVQEVTPLTLFADVSKSDMKVPQMVIPESPTSVQNSALSTKENTSPSFVSSTADKNMSLGADVRVELPQALQNTTETQSAMGLPSIATPYCWNSAAAAHKNNAEDHSPAKKRDLQTMQNRSSTAGSSMFASQKDHQSPMPFSYTQESAMAKTSFLSNTSAVKSPFSPGRDMNIKPESTHSAHFATGSHDAVETGRQEAPGFANLFEANTPGATNNQPLVPQGNLFGSPGGEASRASREGQDVASRFNRRKR